MQNLRRSFLIRHPKLDGTDCDRFFAEIANHCDGNVAEARALQRRIFDNLAPLIQRAALKLKEASGSAHRRRWQNLYD